MRVRLIQKNLVLGLIQSILLRGVSVNYIQYAAFNVVCYILRFLCSAQIHLTLAFYVEQLYSEIHVKRLLGFSNSIHGEIRTHDREADGYVHG